MNKIIYKVIKHDGAWAYQANGILSQQFQTREAARNAARLAAAAYANGQAAAAQAAATVSTPRSSEDHRGQWSDDTG
jgi:hypothetical protein